MHSSSLTQITVVHAVSHQDVIQHLEILISVTREKLLCSVRSGHIFVCKKRTKATYALTQILWKILDSLCSPLSKKITTSFCTRDCGGGEENKRGGDRKRGEEGGREGGREGRKWTERGKRQRQKDTKTNGDGGGKGDKDAE